MRAREPAAGRPRESARATWTQAIEHWKRIESQNPAYLALVAQRLLEALPRGRARRGRPHAARRLPRALSVARPARHRVPADARGEGARGGLRAGARRAASATRRCSASTACSRRRSSPPARPTSAAISSWCATSCTATPGASRATAARPAASRRASSTGAARLRRLGDLSAAAHRGVRTDSMNAHEHHCHRHRLRRPGHRRLPRRRRQRRVLPRRRRAQDRAC